MSCLEREVPLCVSVCGGRLKRRKEEEGSEVALDKVLEEPGSGVMGSQGSQRNDMMLLLCHDARSVISEQGGLEMEE